eukprot:Gb_11146 [translate_table: standard]
MAGLFDKQASEYADARPQYPPDLFSFIAAHTPNLHLAWDVGTGNGQAAVALSHHYTNVIATDVSERQLEFTEKRPNIRYSVTPEVMSEEELESIIGPEGSVDLVTVAQALHWFDLPSFYAQVKRVLRKPGGVMAAWCYTLPVIKPSVDHVLWEMYGASAPFWDPARRFVDEEYRSLEFPFEAPRGLEGNGPFRFEAKRDMKIDDLLAYITTWSAFQTAKANGVNLFDEETVRRFREAWGSDQDIVSVTHGGRDSPSVPSFTLCRRPPPVGNSFPVDAPYLDALSWSHPLPLLRPEFCALALCSPLPAFTLRLDTLRPHPLLPASRPDLALRSPPAPPPLSRR